MSAGVSELKEREIDIENMRNIEKEAMEGE